MKVKCSTQKCKKNFSKTGANHKYCRDCALERDRERHRKFHRNWLRNPKNRKRMNNGSRNWASRNKEICLSHYGRDGKLLCKQFGCGIGHIDMLTLDHVNNNGAEDRRQGLRDSGALYSRLISLGFPKGFQTLCWNHQWKKEMLKRRKHS